MLLPCPVFRPAPNIVLSLRKNTARILMKFAGGNHYREQIKWLYFVRNWNRNKGAGYEKKFIRIDVSRFCRGQASAEALRMHSQISLHSRRQMRSWTQFHVNLKISLTILQQCFIHRTIIQYLSTADIIRSFIWPFSLAMATPVPKTFTMIVGEMQWRRHHMTAWGL